MDKQYGKSSWKIRRRTESENTEQHQKFLKYLDSGLRNAPPFKTD